MTPPTAAFDPAIHPIARLRICAALAAARATQYQRECKFQALIDATGLSASALSKNLSALEELGYVSRVREYGSTRAKDSVWVSLTPAGLRAFEAHMAALRELSGAATTTPSPKG
ncbi:MarR family transcriptional regulator [Corynebacterium sp. 13CS0277]|uniref:transcriptional regulator n=1 Tax=Corynebacterium sp. 13CS0277 TaxID=2071994 RepID=UPI000D03669E|nr:transcriptional regulator [Corynebacterium sp. 13CS0277]PRQ11685.1 MarR family transcriptional regulator [Corynebacterium sp. 13CS0277]